MGFIHVDFWRKSVNLDIPVASPRVGQEIVIGTPEHDYIVSVQDISGHILIGRVQNSPPVQKEFRKNDQVMFHRENIINVEKRPKVTARIDKK